MQLSDLIVRSHPQPWSEDASIPWNEPEFSQAMPSWRLNRKAV